MQVYLWHMTKSFCKEKEETMLSGIMKKKFTASPSFPLASAYAREAGEGGVRSGGQGGRTRVKGLSATSAGHLHGFKELRCRGFIG